MKYKQYLLSAVVLVACYTNLQAVWPHGIYNGTPFYAGYSVADISQASTKDARAEATHPLTGFIKTLAGVRGGEVLWAGPFSLIRTIATPLPWPGHNDYGQPKRMTICLLEPNFVANEGDLECNAKKDSFVGRFYIYETGGNIVIDRELAPKGPAGQKLVAKQFKFPSAEGSYIYIDDKLEPKIISATAAQFVETEIQQAKEKFEKTAVRPERPAAIVEKPVVKEPVKPTMSPVKQPAAPIKPAPQPAEQPKSPATTKPAEPKKPVAPKGTSEFDDLI